MDTRNTIETWCKLASGDKVESSDAFFQFMAVWVAFNALYAFQYGDEVDSDEEQVRCFAHGEAPRKIHLDLLNDQHYATAVNYLKSKGVGNLK